MSESISNVATRVRMLLWGAFLFTLLVNPVVGVFALDCEPGWETFPGGQINTVYAVLEHEGIVYRGGWFSLFRWNGSSWEEFGGGIGGSLTYLVAAAFTVYAGPSLDEGSLVIGGFFPTAGDIEVNSIATWDGQEFEPLGTGVDGEVQALTVYNGDLVAGGRFTTAGGVQARNIARWGGSSWLPLGAGVFDAIPDGTTDGVTDMVVWGDDLYVVGDFTHAGTSQVDYIARWDGSDWSEVGGGVSLEGGGPTGLRGVDVFGEQLVIVGAFDYAGEVEAINVAGWDGSDWSPFGPGADPYDEIFGLRQAALSVASYKDQLYVGGDFTNTAGPEALALAVWDGESWQAVDDGLSGQGLFGPVVFDLSVAGEGDVSSLLMGGEFDLANGEPTDPVARYTFCEQPSDVAWGEAPRSPLQLRLFPNPAQAGPFYAFQLSEAGRVRVSLFDSGGRKVGTLLDRSLGSGVHSYPLVPEGGSSLPAGVYYIRVDANGLRTTKKVTLIP